MTTRDERLSAKKALMVTLFAARVPSARSLSRRFESLSRPPKIRPGRAIQLDCLNLGLMAPLISSMSSSEARRSNLEIHSPEHGYGTVILPENDVFVPRI